MRSRLRPGDFTIESENSYDYLKGLEIPAFLIPANHGQYAYAVDGTKVLVENLGPSIISFNIGGYHFTCVNTFDPNFGDRVFMKKLNLFVFPGNSRGRCAIARWRKIPKLTEDGCGGSGVVSKLIACRR